MGLVETRLAIIPGAGTQLVLLSLTLLFLYDYPADTTKMALTETKLAIIPGGGMF